MLNSLGVDWVNLNSIPLIRFDYDKVYRDIKDDKISFQSVEELWVNTQINLCNGSYVPNEYILAPDVIKLYKDLFTKIKFPLLEKIIKDDRSDRHPTTEESLSYINEVLTFKELINFKKLASNTIPERF
jgi:hypothetical protein